MKKSVSDEFIPETKPNGKTSDTSMALVPYRPNPFEKFLRPELKNASEVSGSKPFITQNDIEILNAEILPNPYEILYLPSEVQSPRPPQIEEHSVSRPETSKALVLWQGPTNHSSASNQIDVPEDLTKPIFDLLRIIVQLMIKIIVFAMRRVFLQRDQWFINEIEGAVSNLLDSLYNDQAGSLGIEDVQDGNRPPSSDPIQGVIALPQTNPILVNGPENIGPVDDLNRPTRDFWRPVVWMQPENNEDLNHLYEGLLNPPVRSLWNALAQANVEEDDLLDEFNSCMQHRFEPENYDDGDYMYNDLLNRPNPALWNHFNPVDVEEEERNHLLDALNLWITGPAAEPDNDEDFNDQLNRPSRALWNDFNRVEVEEDHLTALNLRMPELEPDNEDLNDDLLDPPAPVLWNAQVNVEEDVLLDALNDFMTEE